jgi:phytoene dehydrogenase-like protein
MNGGQLLAVICSLVLCTNWSIVTSFRTDQNNRGRDLRNVDSPANAHFVRRQNPALKATARDVSVCIVGGGVSGLTAAISASRHGLSDDRVILLESSPSVGGRVQSDITDDGLTLDRGFAVFIEEYPYSKQLLDYDSLELRKFLPGALVKLSDKDSLARVADPLRQPMDIFAALFADVGSFMDKIKVLPLVFHVKTSTVEELFEEPETDTLSALRNRWGFSDDIINKFFKPFLEGIYLAPLEEQSSRMFSFVFKMFSDGAATLPTNGMGAISKQLAAKATSLGVDIRTNSVVTRIVKEKSGFKIKCSGGDIYSKTVIVATDGPSASKLLATVDGLNALSAESEQTQRSVGCLYYSFKGKAPVEEPILILNGVSSSRGNEMNPVNNVCFPSVVSEAYTPSGTSLCSVTVLKDAMTLFQGRHADLDLMVRKQLSTWFPDHSDSIINKWRLERIYHIENAQPAQLSGPRPANANGGRPCDTFCGMQLPHGLFVCGDHVATATLNGALESGVNAGNAAKEILSK